MYVVNTRKIDEFCKIIRDKAEEENLFFSLAGEKAMKFLRVPKEKLDVSKSVCRKNGAAAPEWKKAKEVGMKAVRPVCVTFQVDYRPHLLRQRCSFVPFFLPLNAETNPARLLHLHIHFG